MGIKSWWASADPVGKKILAVFGSMVLLAIIYTAITAIF